MKCFLLNLLSTNSRIFMISPHSCRTTKTQHQAPTLSTRTTLADKHFLFSVFNILLLLLLLVFCCGHKLIWSSRLKQIILLPSVPYNSSILVVVGCFLIGHLNFRKFIIKSDFNHATAYNTYNSYHSEHNNIKDTHNRRPKNLWFFLRRLVVLASGLQD